MKRSEYLNILKLSKRTLSEYENWGENELHKTPLTTVTNDELRMTKSSKTTPISLPNSLEELQQAVSKCVLCPLGKTRLTAVFGEGNPKAEIMFVGEGPGFEEDHHGRPFIGKAGQFLTGLIESMSFKREDVFIANIVKCHPMKDPSNPEARGNDRPPTEAEVAVCCQYLEKQIEIIKPKVIVTLGKPSAAYFLKTDLPMGKIRGNFTEYKGIKLMPTFHPSYLIRNGCILGKKDQPEAVTQLKADVWHDLKTVRDYVKKA